MKKLFALLATALLGFAACTQNDMKDNPFLAEYETPFGIPPFEQIEYRHYMPAIQEGIKQHNAEIEAIIANEEDADWENTILALDNSGQLLNRVSAVLFALTSSDNTEEMQALSEEALPLISAHGDEVGMNAGLFARIKQVYDKKDELHLDTAQLRLLDETYRGFVRSGALLSGADQDTLKAINERLTMATLSFSNTLLAANKAAEIIVDDEERLEGLSAETKDGAREEAKTRNKGTYVLTVDYAVRLEVLTNADDRALRQQMYETYTSLATDSAYDNSANIDAILRLRQRKAELLGYKNYAAYQCDNVMSKTPEAAQELLMQLWGPAVAKVKEEVADMQVLLNEDIASGKVQVTDETSKKIQPWDYYYYAEKVKARRYNLTENDTKPYFELNNVIEKGIFNLAKKLYGITFEEVKNAPKYNPEVTVYEVKDAQGEHVSIFMFDPYVRNTKVQGAWMSEFQGACDYDSVQQRPIVFNVLNLAKPTAGNPTLLTLDEVQTIFHEFGHGLQGMLTRAKYRGQAGTNVDRDAVELPSQINEKWALEPVLLKEYALHYKTGEVMPDSLINKLLASAQHNQGFMTCELVGAALLDLAWHTTPLSAETVDAVAFEQQVAEKLGKPAEVQFRYRSPYFKHIFGDEGYAAGYYTYLWADVLVSDGYDLFRERGAFDRATADSYRQCILEPGGSRDAMELFVRFRGHKPSVEALLRDRGLK